MNLKDFITNEITKTSAGGSYDDIDSPVIKPGIVFEVRHVSVENRTTAYTRLTIGIADGISFFEKEAEDRPSANNIYWTRSKFLIPAGKMLRARLSGCTSGDKIYVTYEGYLYEVSS